MSNLAACWNIAGTAQGADAFDEDLLTWQMHNCRIFRVMCHWQEGDFDPDDRIWVSPITHRQLAELTYRYRIRLLLCLDPCRGTSARTYHKTPHELDVAKLERYFRGLLEFYVAEPHEPLYGGEFGNELNYMGWLNRPYTWEQYEPWYHRIADAFFPIQTLFHEFFPEAPFMVGGNPALTADDKPDGPPSILRWMGQLDGDFWLAWHASQEDTTHEIRERTRELRRETGKTVAITEDVYNDAPALLARAKAARDGGSPLYTAWYSWPEQLSDWQSGAGIAPDVFGHPWDAARAAELTDISRAYGRYRPHLAPRSGSGPPPPPPPEPDPLTKRERFIRLIAGVAREESRRRHEPLDDIARGSQWAARPILKFLDGPEPPTD